MGKFSISFTLGKVGTLHGANIKHNNRKFTAVNADDKKYGECDFPTTGCPRFVSLTF